MMNIGTPEMIVIFVAVLLIFGPKSLPKLGRALGDTIREFRHATSKMADSINQLDEEPAATARRGEAAKQMEAAPAPAAARSLTPPDSTPVRTSAAASPAPSAEPR